ncbi:FadR/GntR family transcriptional regulator [Brachybacterium hainanense]|uniref:FadR/GntR family transcriptional regulator n=1 Tax=Brachybacterium hainanense TaxID=1541174 RepID=A0ABV6R699_9MICO
MVRRLLVEDVLDGLRERIIAGEFPVDSPLPGELELVGQYEVSRVTVREAIKVLHAQGLVRAERGRGTFVNPMRRWTSLPAVVRALGAQGDPRQVSLDLLEMRRVLEGGAAELAAQRIGSEELTALARLLETMRGASAAADVEAFVRADLGFHAEILAASGNAFLPVLMEPLSAVLAAARAQTSAVPEIQAHAIEEHARILAALAGGDGAAARTAMDAHMQQTAEDLSRYIIA